MILNSTSHRTKKIEQPPKFNESSQDVYSIFQNSLARYFKDVRENAASYLQSVSDIQEEIIKSRKKDAENAISLQKVAYEKLGENNKIPNATINLAKSFANQATASWTLQNQLILSSLETLSKNIEAFNKNSMAFEEINKKLVDHWASIIKQAAKK